MGHSGDFPIVLAGSFVSQIGSHFLTLALSSYVFITTGSAINAGLVFVLTFFPSVLAGPALGALVDRLASRRFLIINELLSILATVVVGACIKYAVPIALLGFILVLRSLLMFVGRTTVTKWIKVTSSPNKQTSRIKLFYLTFFISTAVSGLFAAVFLSHFEIWIIAVFNAFTFILAILIFTNLQYKMRPGDLADKSTDRSVSLLNSLKEIMSIRAVRISFILVCASQALFQGAYSSFVSFLPIKTFNAGMEGIGFFQLAASAGIILGFLVIWFFPKVLEERESGLQTKALIAICLAILFVLGATATKSMALSLGSFMIFNLAFECVWLHYSSEFFRASPRAVAARYQFVATSVAAFLMSVYTLAYSAAAQFLGPFAGTLLVIFVTILFTSGAWLLGTARQIRPEVG